jgi:hypothetical protein
MEKHQPFNILLARNPDFRVNYRLYTAEEGGRYSLPFQGTRFDFWYEHEEHKKGMLFMKWPEFEDECGNVITDKVRQVLESGTALMWIVNKDSIEYHKGKIKIGTHGFFKEGNTRVGECEVIELINLK